MLVREAEDRYAQLRRRASRRELAAVGAGFVTLAGVGGLSAAFRESLFDGANRSGFALGATLVAVSISAVVVLVHGARGVVRRHYENARASDPNLPGVFPPDLLRIFEDEDLAVAANLDAARMRGAA